MAGARTKLGDVVAGRYRLDAIAGRGGVGVVHRATDTANGRDVQVTLLYARIRAVLDADRVEPLRGALGSLAHPALAVPIDVVVDPASVVTRPVEGRSLAGVLADGPLGEAAVVDLGVTLAEGLAALHAGGLVHRWIRPSAVSVDAHGRPLLLDIGVTELLKPQYYAAFERLIGTTAYVSPEQVWNEQVGPATDVYALGLVLLEALTGVPVHPGTTAADAVARTLVAPVAPDTADPRLVRLLVAATAFRPEQRPSAAALATGFRDLLAPPPLDVDAAAEVPPAARSARARSVPRRPRILVAGGLALLAATLLAGGSAAPDRAGSPIPVARSVARGSSALGAEHAPSPVVGPTATPSPAPSTRAAARPAAVPSTPSPPAAPAAPAAGPAASASPTRTTRPTPSASPSPKPTGKPTPEPTPQPTASTTPSPTATPIATPTPTGSPVPPPASR